MSDRRPVAARGDVVTFRPRRLRIVGLAFTVGMCAVCAFGWFSLPVEMRVLFSWSQRLTLLAFLAFIVVVLLALTSSYVRADGTGVRIRNGLRTHQVAWHQVHKVLLRPGDPWGLLLVRPDDGSPFEVEIDAEKRQLMGIQSNDGVRAKAAITELQRRQRAAQAA